MDRTIDTILGNADDSEQCRLNAIVAHHNIHYYSPAEARSAPVSTPPTTEPTQDERKQDEPKETEPKQVRGQSSIPIVRVYRITIFRFPIGDELMMKQSNRIKEITEHQRNRMPGCWKLRMQRQNDLKYRVETRKPH